MSPLGSTPGVAVVTGGALGIGAAIAEELGRQGYYVVTVDPGVAVDGSAQPDDTEPTTAQRIIDAGGNARASNISVTDEEAVRALFAGLVEEFGALDTIVNVAGITRPTGFASGLDEDWAAVLDVHLNGYLNVLRAALPIMVTAGYGRILGVTSGSGWRPADAGAYSCAKRAVAALTWQLGQAAPIGVSINALSPIAATRMVLQALARLAPAGGEAGRTAASGGVSLAMGVPPPEHLGPIGAYLAGAPFAAWCRGQVMFSNGSEVSWVVPPRLLEVVPTEGAGSLSQVLEQLGPSVLAPAEVAQATNGGGNPRAVAVNDVPAAEADPTSNVGRAVVVTDIPAWDTAIGTALAARGVECISVSPAPDAVHAPKGFETTAERLAAVTRDKGPLDAVIVALAGGGVTTTAGSPGAADWQRILDEHSGITEHIRADAEWTRAVANHAAETDRPMRVVTISDATTCGGTSRAQAAAQLSRAAHLATSDRVDAFAIGVQSTLESVRQAVADVAAYLVTSADSNSLSGAELVADAGWFGLRTHPQPAGTITFDGPAVPDWLDAALRGMVAGEPR
ncbi:MAG: SDR family NAD(P)-dependent oxidoreductase [Actinobacteria bacterium]|nr:SDR family NAD(P)-dependent oxidoreductase [Actinomycetota bacterium]